MSLSPSFRPQTASMGFSGSDIGMKESSVSAGNLLPPINNHALHVVSASKMYNPPLILIAEALLLHSSLFGIIFLLRGFSPARVLDIHFLTIVFALTFPVAAWIFLLDTRIDGLKLLFLLDHEAIEVILALRIFLLPKRALLRNPGGVLLGCWIALCAVSIVVAANPDGHATDLIAWGAFLSDGLATMAGGVLMARYFRGRRLIRMQREEERREAMIEYWGWKKKDGTSVSVGREIKTMSAMWERKVFVEGMAGLGFFIHGISAMAIGPIWTRVLYHNLNPQVFAYACFVVFSCAFIAVALCVPSAALFFSAIRWCCWHDRKHLPGESGYSGLEDGESGEYPVVVEGAAKAAPPSMYGPSSSKATTLGHRPSPPPTADSDKPPMIPFIPEQQRTRFSNWFSVSGASSSSHGKRASPRSDALDQWERLQQQYIQAQAHSLAHVRSSFSNSNTAHHRNLSSGSLTRYHGHHHRTRNGSGSFAASSMTVDETRDAVGTRHARSGTQDSSSTMVLPPSPSPPGISSSSAPQQTRPVAITLQPPPPTPNTTFVFPGPHRSSSLARLAAWQQQQLPSPAQQLVFSLQNGGQQPLPTATYPSRPVHRRYYGSDGSIRDIADVKGKGRKRSGSIPAGYGAGSTSRAEKRLGGQLIPSGNNMIYWTSLGAKYANDVDRGRKGSAGSGGMGNKI